MSNYKIPDDFEIQGGPKTKARNNIKAITLLKAIEEQGKPATSEEQTILAHYVGWGGIPQIFNPTPDPDWADLSTQIKEILEPQEYSSAFESVLNAHYTSPVVIREIYQGLEHLGFAGGKILEPSMGVGNFLGLLPSEMERRSEVTGIELDTITGRIAQQLYPDCQIHVQGFEKTALPKDYFDLAISNVPFGDYRVADPEYNDQNLKIHNYFIARSLDRVRPGGLVAVITSTGTMQSNSGEPFRAWLSERSNLLGAMRLPGDAFKGNAGTEVTTDLLVLQKLGPMVEPNHEGWIGLSETTVKDSEGNVLKTNEYYARHPARMLGVISDDKLHPGRLALRSDGRDLSEAMRDTFQSFPAQVYSRNNAINPLTGEASRLSTLEDGTLRTIIPPEYQSSVKDFGYLAHQGDLWQRQGDWINQVSLKEQTKKRVLGMLEIRDEVRNVFVVQLQGGTDAQLNQAQAKLNQVYDRFVQTYGNLIDSANARAFSQDPDAQLLKALERENRQTGETEKTDVFSRRTVRPRVLKDQAETAQEALLTSLNEYGRVVPGYMAQLLRKEESEIITELRDQDLIYLDPETRTWQTQDEYLSGDVRQKLKLAQVFVTEDSQFLANINALEAVQPVELGPGEIEVRLGAPWVPAEVISDFAHELLDLDKERSLIQVSHNAQYAIWAVDSKSYAVHNNAQNNATFGTKELSALEILELSLNLKDAAVYHADADGNRHIAQEATLSARMKQQQIQEQFKSFVWKDFERSEQLCKIYNEVFNSRVVRRFRNPNLELSGSNAEIELRSHQKDAVWRILQSESTMLAHTVGAGKTFAMIAGALELRRMDIAQKPMIVVPNHMLGQFTRELYQLYPSAKVLAPTEKDTQASKRKELMARIATGDWDAVIVTHAAFTRLPISQKQKEAFYQEQLSEIKSLLEDTETKQSNAVVKQLGRERRKLEDRIERITQSKIKDDGVTFDQLGIDALFVDEAHFWKNLGRNSKLQNIAGLSNTNSQRAMDAFIKCGIVRANGGRLVFATGTPVSNSIAELYTMQRFLQPEALKRQGIENFDAWVGAFAEKVTAPEIDPTGRFKIKTRLTRFTNVPELMSLFREVTDIQTAQQLKLPRPEVERLTIAAGASPIQLRYMERLIERAELVAARKVEPNQDNMLWVTTDGRRAALDPRLISKTFPDYPESKVNQAIANIHAIWQATESQQLAQMVFCDLGTPKSAKEGEPVPFSIYQHVKDGLIARGIPSPEIAFIHDAPKSSDKEKLYKNLREGRIRVLIGSTEKCGVGMNVQDRLVAEHHFDPPWRPSDIEQREGRILRQGNLNQKVFIATYVTQGREGQLGFDSYSWQTLARKAEMVAQVMNGDTSIRSVDDVSSSALSFDEIKAIATGNPLILEKANVDNRVSELSRYRQTFLNDRHSMQKRIGIILPNDIAYYERQVATLSEDVNQRVDVRGDSFVMKIGKREYIDRTEAGEMLLGVLGRLKLTDKKGRQEIGEFAGFTLVAYNEDRNSGIRLQSNNGREYIPRSESETPKGIVQTLTNLLNNLPEQLETARETLNFKTVELETLRSNLDKPFDYENELDKLLQRQQEINTELGLNKSDEQVLNIPVETESQEETLEQSDEEKLINLDEVVTADSGMNWLTDEVEVWVPSNTLCEPSPEVLEMIERIDEFMPISVKPIQIATQITPEPPHILSADQEKDLQFLRRWYAIAESLDRPQTYLDRIKELAQEIKEGQPLSQKAREAMAFDGQVYQKSSAQLIDDAQKILQSRGQITDTGARVFAGQIYTIASQQGALNVRSQDRGVILEIQNQKVTTIKLRQQDFSMFHAFSQQQIQQQFRGLRH